MSCWCFTLRCSVGNRLIPAAAARCRSFRGTKLLTWVLLWFCWTLNHVTSEGHTDQQQGMCGVLFYLFCIYEKSCCAYIFFHVLTDMNRKQLLPDVPVKPRRVDLLLCSEAPLWKYLPCSYSCILYAQASVKPRVHSRAVKWVPVHEDFMNVNTLFFLIMFSSFNTVSSFTVHQHIKKPATENNLHYSSVISVCLSGLRWCSCLVDFWWVYTAAQTVISFIRSRTDHIIFLHPHIQ